MNARRPMAKWFGASIILAAGSLLLLTRAWAATVVSGNVSGTWTTNGSPYILSADCTVVSNQTLTIQPGVEVIMGPGVSFSIEGTLSAVGTPDLPISIRGASATNYWSSIALYSTGVTNRFHYCRIRDARYQAVLVHVLGRNRTGIAEIINCDFLNCRGAAIAGDATGISPLQQDGGSATVMCVVENCAFDLSGDGCLFSVFSGAGTHQASAEIVTRIEGNVFRRLSGAALNLYWNFGNGYATNLSRPVFINNAVVGASRGVVVTYPRFLPMIENNVFMQTSNAVFCTSDGGGNFNTSYNCFFANTANFVGYPGIYGVPVQDNRNGDPCDAFFNIFLDPQFLDTNRFLLSNFSPCVDAGDPAIADVCFQFS